jgi:hypothetical protein
MNDKQNETIQMIDLIVGQTRLLLENHWTDIQHYRNGDDAIKIGFSHTVSYEASERIIKTAITFSHRIKDSVEESINTAQTELPLPGKRK